MLTPLDPEGNALTKIMLIVGTRPEVIKMAPLLRELQRRGDSRTLLISTGQHRDMSAQALASFELTPDRDLGVMREDQELPALTAMLLEALARTIREDRPDIVLVQGDTTTVLAGALAAFYERVPLGHVEAGLRSHDDGAPWPEEMNRRVADSIARWCFAPTEGARRNLLGEGIPDQRIFVTGNTVIDALLWMHERVRRRAPELPPGLREFIANRRTVLVTGHRRESFGPILEGLCHAMARIAEQHPDVALVYPVHLNPRVLGPVHRLLGGRERILLLDPLSYDAFVWLMDRSHVVLTDSGGVQEEAPALGKPVVVMRERSERPEGVEAGNARVVGTQQERIYEEVHRLLTSDQEYRARAKVTRPYGDGFAAGRIADVLARPA